MINTPANTSHARKSILRLAQTLFAKLRHEKCRDGPSKSRIENTVPNADETDIAISGLYISSPNLVF